MPGRKKHGTRRMGFLTFIDLIVTSDKMLILASFSETNMRKKSARSSTLNPIDDLRNFLTRLLPEFISTISLKTILRYFFT